MQANFQSPCTVFLGAALLILLHELCTSTSELVHVSYRRISTLVFGLPPDISQNLRILRCRSPCPLLQYSSKQPGRRLILSSHINSQQNVSPPACRPDGSPRRRWPPGRPGPSS
jgi:hypothetical protein